MSCRNHRHGGDAGVGCKNIGELVGKGSFACGGRTAKAEQGDGGVV